MRYRNHKTIEILEQLKLNDGALLLYEDVFHGKEYCPNLVGKLGIKELWVAAWKGDVLPSIKDTPDSIVRWSELGLHNGDNVRSAEVQKECVCASLTLWRTWSGRTLYIARYLGKQVLQVVSVQSIRTVIGMVLSELEEQNEVISAKYNQCYFVAENPAKLFFSANYPQ